MGHGFGLPNPFGFQAPVTAFRLGAVSGLTGARLALDRCDVLEMVRIAGRWMLVSALAAGPTSSDHDSKTLLSPILPFLQSWLGPLAPSRRWRRLLFVYRDIRMPAA